MEFTNPKNTKGFIGFFEGKYLDNFTIISGWVHISVSQVSSI